MIDDEDLYDSLSPSDLWRVDIAAGVTGDAAQVLAENLEDLAISVSSRNRDSADGDCWDIALTVAGRPDEAALRERLGGLPFTVARVEEKDWLRAVHQDFPPLTVGGFFVYGSHYEGDRPYGLTPLRIDAATAFGSGEHETTQGCLLALESLARTHVFKNALDMGCGSGILSVAAAKLWPEIRVTAIDIDPESTTVTRRHAGMNGVESALVVETGDGYAAPLAQAGAPYDLIVANILAGPLIEMAGDLAAALNPGGFAVLSGLLRRQMSEVAAAHTARGLVPEGRTTLGEWEALVFKKPVLSGRVSI